ncbi:phosphatase inhibitor-domain-containing protein [Crassisporium funariophilum]|nr:phosphatase inhibitor-domain-containing protein [Crassisporium funariophilum]
MYSSSRNGPSTAAPAHGSRTLTITSDPIKEEDDDERGEIPDGSQVVGTLNLRANTRRNRPRVAWGEDVVDNEGCGKKKSKICCIYHKPRRFDESSDESSDSDSDDSACGHNHNHSGPNHRPAGTGPSSDGLQARSGAVSSVVHELEHPEGSEPNAYEKQPESKKGKRRAP